MGVNLELAPKTERAAGERCRDDREAYTEAKSELVARYAYSSGLIRPR